MDGTERSNRVGMPLAPLPPEPFTVGRGWPLPRGVMPAGNGFNFSLFSRHGTRVWLELYDAPDAGTPTHRFELSPAQNRTGDIWHIWLGGVQPGQLYGYRIDGPYRPLEGHRFNYYKLLLDPRATAIVHLDNWSFAVQLGYDPLSPLEDLSYSTVDSAPATPKCVVTRSNFDWGDDAPPKRPWSETIIYETHVRGLTIHPTAQVAHPGTYAGLIEKISYFLDLGVTAVELLPVQEFNENGVPRINPLTGEPLRQYWGYDPAAFLAPNGLYSSAGTRGEQINEFKAMVKALHAAGIEVIVDIVLNHSAEGNRLGPTFNGRGIDNQIFYMLEDNPRFYRDFTGTGNTVNANQPVIRDFILDGLRYWVAEMRVDGFRFDLASVLGRDEDGSILPDPPLLERIAEDPVLRDAKLIAEAWDAAGAYQVGRFAGQRWADWNGRYRDDVRRYWRGDPGMRGIFASRISGSQDVFGGSGRGPEASINYVTSHDGFTLNDLVSYGRKHNEANGEFNLDGAYENYSANYGFEGETDIPRIEVVRQRQIKNFLLTLFISRGVPMLLGGDEFRRTQYGNNNAYCQDNEISWYNWEYLERHRDIYRFTRAMIRLRRELPVLRKEAFYTDDEVRWFGPNGSPPDWGDRSKHALAVLVIEEDSLAIFLMFNPDPVEHDFAVPAPPPARQWYLRVDTARPSPNDVYDPGSEELLFTDLGPQSYRVAMRSSVLLVAR